MIKIGTFLFIILMAHMNKGFTANYCQSLSQVKSNSDLDKVVKLIIDEHNKKFKRGYNRHQIGSALNQCIPTKNSKALFLSFAGTGAFNPRSYHLMRELIQCNKHDLLTTSVRNYSYSSVLKSLKAKKSSYTKWSGIEKGPLNLILKRDRLLDRASEYDYAIFASEESELLASIDNISFEKLEKITEEYSRSTIGYPRGITDALVCSKKYFEKADELGIEPKLIIMTHSSGGRSAVKFLENLKKLSEKNADLVFTMDPVIEAHEAIFEVIPGLSHKLSLDALDYITPGEIEDKRVKIWSKKRPKSLYKTSNTKRWISTYQNIDTNGLGMSPKFGICGSPIHKADKNLFIDKGLGKSGHGQITYHWQNLQLFKEEILDL